MDDVRQFTRQLEHAPSPRRDEDPNVGARCNEVQLRTTDAHHLALEIGLLAAPHTPADLDAFAHRMHGVRARLTPEGGLLDASADAHDGAPVRQLVHRRQGHRGEARVAYVRVGDQALDFQSSRGLQTRGHDHETILVETPITDAEAVEAGCFGALGELDESAGRLLPADRRQIAEGELHVAATGAAPCSRAMAAPMPRTVSA